MQISFWMSKMKGEKYFYEGSRTSYSIETNKIFRHIKKITKTDKQTRIMWKKFPDILFAKNFRSFLKKKKTFKTPTQFISSTFPSIQFYYEFTFSYRALIKS